MRIKKKMKNQGYFKAIAVILAFALFSSQLTWAYAEYTVRKGRNKSSYDMNWAPKMMDDITMDSGEGWAYVGTQAATTVVTLGAGAAAGPIANGLTTTANTAANIAINTGVYAGCFAAAGGINAAIMGGDVGKGALIGGITGGITGGVGAAGLGGGNWAGAGYGALIGSGVGSGVGYLVDKDNWWVYGLQGAAAGATAGYNVSSKLSNPSKPFWKDLAYGYATRVLTGLTSEAINTQVYLDTYDENTGKYDIDKAYLYSAIGCGLVAGLMNPGAALRKDISNQASTGEVLLAMGEGALVGGLGGLAGGLLVQEVRKQDWINEDDFQYASPVIYQLGSLAGLSWGRATFDPDTKGIENILLAPVNEFASKEGWPQLLGMAVKAMTQKEIMDDLSPSDKDYQRRMGYAYILADTAGRTASILGEGFYPDRKPIPEKLYENLIKETLSPAVTLELNLAWRETGASNLSAAYYVNLATSGANVDSYLNTFREGASFGYRYNQNYTPLQWGNFVSNLQNIASPLTYPTRIRDSQTGEYRTDAYWVNVLNSGSEANISNLFGVEPEDYLDLNRSQNLPRFKNP